MNQKHIVPREYKLIYVPYLLGPLLSQLEPTDDLKDEKRQHELKDVNEILNAHARDGWVVKNSGVIEDTSTAERVIFWVLMESH